MRPSLLLLVFIAVMLPIAKGEGSDAESDATGDAESASNAARIWQSRERVHGWGADKQTPALRIKDGDRKKPARDRPTWKEWRKKQGALRTYRNTSDEELHARIFEESEVIVKENNDAFTKGQTSYKLAINEFADFTELEFARLRMSDDFVNELHVKRNETYNLNDMDDDGPRRASRQTIAATFDWRDRIPFNEVQNQGLCGSCYAFAQIATIEAQIAIKTGVKVKLSEQYLMDCTYRFKKSEERNNGCQGGVPWILIEWLNNTKRGLRLEDEYKYKGAEGTCPTADHTREVFHLKNVVTQYKTNEDGLEEMLIKNGPMFVALCVPDWHDDLLLYSEGIFSSKRCNYRPNHAVTLVGYGNEKGKDFWIIHNSWGSNWGWQGGHFKLQKGVNMCNFPDIVSWPIH